MQGKKYLKLNRVLPPETYSPETSLTFNALREFIDAPASDMTQKILLLLPGFAKFLIFGITHGSGYPLIANLQVGCDAIKLAKFIAAFSKLNKF